MHDLKISVNIPVRPGDDPNIVLGSLQNVKYPKNLFEIIIIEGNHITKQRNRGIKKSKGEIIYLLDNDSYVQPNAFKIISKGFSNPKVAAVGGPSLTPENEKNYLSQLIGYILETYFGAFRMRYKWSRQSNEKVYSDYNFIGCNLALRKKNVLKAGGFDEKFQANDETELLRRFKDNRFLIRYKKNLIVYKHQRKNIYELAKQFNHYGKGRMKHMLKNPKWEDFFLLAPICFAAYLISIIFYHPVWYFIPLALYLSLAILTSLKAAIKYKKLDLLISMTLLYPLIHFSYALGLLKEFILKEANFSNKSTESFRVKFIKTFSD